LPEHGCELISMNEKLDEMAVFRNWFNEQHSRSTSTKVKAVKRMRAQDGKFLGAYAPYGYKKSDENKHVLVPDELTAPIVRKIFELRASGMGYNAVARYLNENDIIAPRDYYYQQKGEENPRRECHCWNSVSLKGLLSNEVYIGNVVSFKQGSESYKSHKLVKKPKDEWIRAENTHEPLIDFELWERVQKLAAIRYIRRPKKDGSTNMFTGLLVCADCGMKMRSATQRKTRKNGDLYEHTNFTCATYSKSGHKGCPPHTIAEKTLHELVVEQIHEHAKMVKWNEGRIVESIVSQQSCEAAASQKTFAAELKSNHKRLAMLDKLIEKLYEDRVNGTVPDSVFKNLIEKYEQERMERTDNVKNLEIRIANIQQNSDNAVRWVKLIKRYATLETLDAGILLLLINRIIVSEATVIDGKRVCDIKIEYNHVGNVDWLSNSGKVIEMEVVHEQAV